MNIESVCNEDKRLTEVKKVIALKSLTYLFRLLRFSNLSHHILVDNRAYSFKTPSPNKSSKVSREFFF